MQTLHKKKEKYLLEIRKKDLKKRLFKKRMKIMTKYNHKIPENLQKKNLLNYIEKKILEKEFDQISEILQLIRNNIFGNREDFNFFEFTNHNTFFLLLKFFSKEEKNFDFEKKEENTQNLNNKNNENKINFQNQKNLENNQNFQKQKQLQNLENKKNTIKIQIGWILVNIIGKEGINLTEKEENCFFDTFYNKIKKLDLNENNINFEILEISIFGLSNLIAESEYFRNFLFKEKFLKFFLENFGNILIQSQDIFCTFFWFLSNLTSDLEKKEDFIKNDDIFVNILLEILNENFMSKNFIDSAIDHFVEFFLNISKIEFFFEKIVNSKIVMDKLNKLILYKNLIVKENIFFIYENLIFFTKKENYDIFLKSFYLENFSFFLRNEKNQTLKNNLLMIISYLVVNNNNLNKILKKEKFFSGIFNEVVKTQDLEFKKNAFCIILNIFKNLDENNSRIIYDNEIYQIVLNGFFFKDNNLISFLIEIICIFLEKIYYLDFWDNETIKEDIVYSKFYRNIDKYRKIKINDENIDKIFDFLKAVF